MSLRARLFFIALGVSVLLIVINLVRTKKLKEEYAILWLFMALFLVFAPIFADTIEFISLSLGVDYAPALLIVATLVCFMLIFFHFSVTISKFSEQIKTLTQSLALTNKRLQDLEAHIAPSSEVAQDE